MGTDDCLGHRTLSQESAIDNGIIADVSGYGQRATDPLLALASSPTPLLYKVDDDGLLLPVHPTSQRNQGELPWIKDVLHAMGLSLSP